MMQQPSAALSGSAIIQVEHSPPISTCLSLQIEFSLSHIVTEPLYQLSHTVCMGEHLMLGLADSGAGCSLILCNALSVLCRHCF